MGDSIVRQIKMLSVLASSRCRTGLTVRQLRDALEEDGFNVSERQLQRDLNALSAYFGLGCNQLGNRGHWYVQGDEVSSLARMFGGVQTRSV